MGAVRNVAQVSSEASGPLVCIHVPARRILFGSVLEHAMHDDVNVWSLPRRNLCLPSSCVGMPWIGHIRIMLKHLCGARLIMRPVRREALAGMAPRFIDQPNNESDRIEQLSKVPNPSSSQPQALCGWTSQTTKLT